MTCFDYYVDPTKAQGGRWTRWQVPEYVHNTIGVNPGESTFSSIYVATVDSTRITHVMSTLVNAQHPVMLVGTAGTGKSGLVNEWLGKLAREDESMLSCNIPMNYYTDSRLLQRQLEGVVDKRSGRVFGPLANKKLIYFVDDLNLPYVEEYGTQNAISLLRQIMGTKEFFDRSDLGFKKAITDVRFVSAMNPTAGSFTISERAQAMFATIGCSMPSSETLTSIYECILRGHFETFSHTLDGLVEPLVAATLSVQRKVTDKFLPSAKRLVYNWSMREVAAVFEGVCKARADFHSSKLHVCRLWLHECRRVYGDRMVDESDITSFADVLHDATKALPVDNSDQPVAEIEAEPLVFTSFVAEAADGNPAYVEIKSAGSLKKVLTNRLAEYNDTHPVMDLVLFEEAMEHVTRIARIITTPGGHALLVGVGGSGKQSLARLAAYLVEYQIRQMNITSDFSKDQFLEYLRDCVKTAGVKGIPLILMLTDQQIVNEEFLVYINDILSTGWIAGLFSPEDLPGVLDGLKSVMRAHNIPDTPQDKLKFLIKRLKQFMHVVLCFSPVGDAFRLRARRFPGLVNCTLIDWFHPWTQAALVSVSMKFLGDVDFGSKEVLENVSYHMATVHQSVIDASKDFSANQKRHNFVTPKSFLEFISFYKALLGSKRAKVGAQIERLSNGLEVLRRTAAKVSELQEDLKITMSNVEDKRQNTEILMQQIGVQRQDAEAQQKKAEAEEEKADAAASEASKIEAEAEAELAEAMPLMEKAQDAVNCLNKASLTELKSMKKPPAAVNKVTKACLIMIEGEFKNFKWDRAKKMMINVDRFMAALKSYDANNMDDKVIDKLTPIINDAKFNYDVMAKSSAAAANLCNWVVSIYKYNRIYIQVKPLMDRLEKAKAEKAEAEEKVSEVRSSLAKVQARLDELKAGFREATEEKLNVERQAKECEDKLGLAERLVNGLASENERWALEVEKLASGKDKLIGDVLVSSAFVGYIGAFDSTHRESLWREMWLRDVVERQIPSNEAENMDPLSILASDSDVAKMLQEGLPADRVSLENGAIISACKRWPLIIDPQEQGMKWLIGRYSYVKEEAKKSGEISPRDIVKPVTIQLTKPKWEIEMAQCMEEGKVIIVENVGEEIDTTLNPILAQQIVRKGRTAFIKFAGKEVEYDPNFRLFLVTKLSNPYYKPEIQAQCTLINFIATESGLEDQLLARVVQEERPDKELEQKELQNSLNKYRVLLTDLEDQLLAKLSNAPEDILSDVPLIEGLEMTKASAIKIGEAVEQAKLTQIEISKIRESYRPVAAEASMLYFMLTRLNMVNHMYRYSLAAFVKFFYKAIAKTSKEDGEGKEIAVDARVSALRDTLRFTIFTWVSRGLFEEHKLILLAQLTFNLMKRGQLACSHDWSDEAFSFLVHGPAEDEDEENPIAEWLSNASWKQIMSLSKIDGFMKLPSDLVEASPRFQDWFTQSAPESEKLPLEWSQLDKAPFLKLLVIKCLRPDRMTAAIEKFVRSTLPGGGAYV